MEELFESGAHEPELSDAQSEQLWQRLSALGATPIIAPTAGHVWFDDMASQASFADAHRSDAAYGSLALWPKQRWVAGLLLAALFAGGGVFAATGFYKLTPLAHAPEATAVTPLSKQSARQRSDLTPQPSASSEVALSANPEATLLLEALKRLRRDNDAAGALSLLNSHSVSFPSGAMKREVTVAKVEALMVLKQRTEALTLLKSEDLDDLPKGAELRVLRGELSGALGHCRDALVDFEPTLSSAASATLKSRALFGRASCRSRLGQHATAQRDFKDYLERYPTGSFAAEAKRALIPR
jgi:tetratricopeptide (TPR) repeat protein